MSLKNSVDSQIRVRYGETDKMGVVYYGNYALYFEIGRTDWIRQFGLSYKEMEDQGIIMPVIKMQTQYIAPAYYDQQLRLTTEVRQKPTARITFMHELRDLSTDQLLNKAEVSLAFVNQSSGRVTKVPQAILDPFLSS